MELSSVTDKLVHNLQRAQIEQVVAVTKALGLKVGSHFLADVQKVTRATPDERAQLIKSIEANLTQLNKNSAAPAIQALIRELESQKNIVQTPGVKLAALSVNIPTPTTTGSTSTPPALPTTLLVYTNQPVQTGQTLLMQLGEGQRLQLLQPLTKAEVASFQALLQIGTLPNSAISNPTNTGNTAAIPNNGLSSEATDAIGETLRLLLPQKDKGQDLLASLPKITQFIQQLPIAERKEWLSSQVQQSLKTLANHIRLSDQLTNPKLVEMTLKNNGQSFENKLAQLITAQQVPTPVSSTMTNTSPVAGNKSVNNQTIAPQNSVEKIASQDLKGALLGLLHQLDSELDTSKLAPVGTSLAADANKNLLPIALPQFLGMLANKQQGELNQKQLRTQLVMLLHQYTLGSIGKIQLQQVHALNHQLGQADQAQPTQSWQFEIPVRQGHEVHPLHIQMEQQWIEEQNSNAEQNNTRARQWNIMLGFDLPVIGKFYAQLLLLGDSLSAKFWAENENTLLDAKNRIDGLKAQLEHEGIKVTQLQWVPGLPPKPKMSISYSLVDIKT